jgi:hypothetical protein
LRFSAPDHVKHNRVCDSNDDGSDNKSSHKEVDHGFTPYALVLIFDSKTVSLVAHLGILPNTSYKCRKHAQAADACKIANRLQKRRA